MILISRQNGANDLQNVLWTGEDSSVQYPCESSDELPHFDDLCGLFDDYILSSFVDEMEQDLSPLHVDSDQAISSPRPGYLPHPNVPGIELALNPSSQAQIPDNQPLFGSSGLEPTNLTVSADSTGRICPVFAIQCNDCSPIVCERQSSHLHGDRFSDIEDHPSTVTVKQRPAMMTTTARRRPSARPSNSKSGSKRQPLANTRGKPKSSPVETIARQGSCLRSDKTISPDEAETAALWAKKSHSIVERRYRENLNTKIALLHVALLRAEHVDADARQTGRRGAYSKQLSRNYEVDPCGEKENKDFGVETSQRESFSKVRKSDVLVQATNYVFETEVELRHMTDEVSFLRDRIRQLEKLVRCEDCTLVKQMANFDLNFQ